MHQYSGGNVFSCFRHQSTIEIFPNQLLSLCFCDYIFVPSVSFTCTKCPFHAGVFLGLHITCLNHIKQMITSKFI